MAMDFDTAMLVEYLGSDSARLKYFVIGCGVGVGTICVVKLINYWCEWERLKKLRNTKAESSARAKKELLQCLGDQRDNSPHQGKLWEAILELSFGDIVVGLQSREIKAVDVLHAYQWKALSVDVNLNCVTEPIQDAEVWARICDESEFTTGPLHGLPVSIKESIPVTLSATTIGLSKYADDIAESDCVLVQTLKRLGAIPFMKTNVPQGMMSFSCSGNPVHGKTLNPHDPKRSPGGSSGGEGSLIGAGGSLLGFGSDTGGSIRIPSHMCGIAGFKPSSNRLSQLGLHPCYRVPPKIQTSLGPLSVNVDGLVLAMRSILNADISDLDCVVPPVSFRNELFHNSDKLRIGFYVSDGYLPATPACARAVLMTKDVLEANGHTIVPWTPPRVKFAMEYLYANAVMGDNGQSFLEEVSHDKIDESVASLYWLLQIPALIRKSLAAIVRPFSPFAAEMLTVGLKLKSVHDYWTLCAHIDEYKEEFTKDWKDAGLDAVICPGFVVPALPHGCSIFPLTFSTALYSMLDFPAGSVPVTKVSKTDDQQLQTGYPQTSFAEKCVRAFGKDSEGLPVNVQCVTLPWQEEKCLRIMKEIETGQEAHKKTL
ncbi:fatty-acid amide hydrolase 1-like [Lineus longissimus]|uniref:fatty-acid amide hydrolase 1-like n=1 Tax=Lineus longissimus TaxID=88925 RepID=UPI00315C7376